MNEPLVPVIILGLRGRWSIGSIFAKWISLVLVITKRITVIIIFIAKGITLVGVTTSGSSFS